MVSLLKKMQSYDNLGNFQIFAGINNFSSTPSKEWFQTDAVLRVSLGNFLFFLIFALIMIGIKDQNDKRDAWHHGCWIAKLVIWALLIVLMFFVPNIVITIYGTFYFLTCARNYERRTSY